MVKSLISEALARHEAERKVDPAISSAGPTIPLNPTDEELARLAEQLKVNIKIVGCGGGGTNTINRCVEEGITGADMAALNTDAKHLFTIKAPKKILIGRRITKGLGAGAKPEIGEEAARENEEEIKRFLNGSDITFITAGMGGGTGTGSAHYVAKLSKEMGSLTMGITTLPFSAEGSVRMEQALRGLDKLRKVCDTTIVISNDKLLELVPRLPLEAAFKVADEVLMTAIKGITEIVTKPGLVNIDYADLQTVMKDAGVALIGLGESQSTTDRVTESVNEAITSPLLGDVELKDAQGALVRVVGGPDMTVSEAQKAAEIVGSKISKRARMIWGCTIDQTMENTIKVLLIITGVNAPSLLGQKSKFSKSMPGVIPSRPNEKDDTDIDFIQ
ncbi:MAG: cell division protein FtsZ [Candidatus Thermoplasmatota archaeon]|jgi:cell division protein FtsZ|nr:cell division protein FtsZ [Candidatus Thermoplasmatota archaeon]MCL5963104.1 cell division protein FtsZ [Candidatus Thermoplasmatota archaeon]